LLDSPSSIFDPRHLQRPPLAVLAVDEFVGCGVFEKITAAGLASHWQAPFMPEAGSLPPLRITGPFRQSSKDAICRLIHLDRTPQGDYFD
jgi:hypothetical protein